MSTDALDRAGEVRGEDAFVLPTVDAFLKERIELSGSPRLTQFPGGASNLTYQLTYDNRELILRRPPGGNLPKSGHDMYREFNVQKKLASVYPYVPQMIAFCEDREVMDRDFYVMEKVSGVILRKNLPRGMSLDPAQARSLSTNWVDRLADLHAVDPATAGLSELGVRGGYVGRQIEGWSRRYARARTWNVPSFKGVMRWLEANQPDDFSTCIIHNDWRLDNVVLDAGDPTQIIAVLDWEMSTLGDPLMDLGAAMAYWIEDGEKGIAERFRMQPSNLPGMMTRDEVIGRYCQQSGVEAEDFRFYEVYGYFRLAGIIQQIYKRYHEGATTNPRFKHFWLLGWWLHGRARKAINR